MVKISQQRVREGEYNEALCFFCDEHPKTEIAAQKAGDAGWNIWYISSKKLLNLGRIVSSQEAAETKAEQLAKYIFNAANPYKEALRY